MGTTSGLAAGNDCNLMQPGFMLLSVGIFILSPAEKRRTESVMMIHMLETPLQKDAQLSCMKALLSLDWSMILFLLAWLCSMDWDVAGPMYSDTPILIQIFLVVYGLGRFLL